jgi:hypothetical protein
MNCCCLRCILNTCYMLFDFGFTRDFCKLISWVVKLCDFGFERVFSKLFLLINCSCCWKCISNILHVVWLLPCKSFL